MFHTKIKQVIRLAVLFTIVGLTLQPIFAASARDKDGPPLPPQCVSIDVENGNKVSFHVYAIGVQVYRWNGAGWVFVEPIAVLYAEENYFGEVGIHYAGPTWESKSGSKVVGVRVPGTGCTPDASAIPWILLSATSKSGPGIFGRTTYIQRVNTTGGIAPTTPGSVINELVEVPYTAEYYFYRGHKN